MLLLKGQYLEVLMLAKRGGRWLSLSGSLTVQYVNFQMTSPSAHTYSISSFRAGSIIGFKGNVGQSAYSASKGGLIGFSRSLAKEVARKKIRVNVVAPGQ